MTSFSLPKTRERIAADEFEANIEKAFVKSETVFVLDGDIVMRLQDGCIQTSDDS